jgi:DNA invertase Pin-like site-specific DNA recombinase
MIALFRLFAEVERDLIPERTRGGLAVGLAVTRAKGKRLGRSKGGLGKSKLDGKGQDIHLVLRKHVSKTSIARIVEVSSTTLHHCIKTHRL